MTSLMKINVVNSLNYGDFISIFGGVIEHNPLCSASVWSKRPFQDVNHLHSEFSNFLDGLSFDGKAGVLRLFPDLAGKHAKSGSLTTESTQEHKSAGLDILTQDEMERMDSLNQMYQNKFGFPFVICTRQNKKESILNGLNVRKENDRDTEIITGVEEVKKICLLRLRDIVDPDSKL